MPARPSAGTTLEIGAATDAAILSASGPAPTDTYTQVTGVFGGLTGPSAESAEIDTTPLEATAREAITDLPDSGSLDFQVNLDGANTSHQTLEADSRALPKPSRNFRITYTDGTVLHLVGEVGSFNRNASQGAQVLADVSITVNGPTFIVYPS